MFRLLGNSLGVCMLALLASVGALRASTLGMDNAANSTYANGGWVTGSNGGTGFLAWTLSPNILVASAVHPDANGAAAAGDLIGTSTQLNPGNTGANIDTAGVSFGLYGQQSTDGTGNGATFDANRLFNGGALSIGQSFSISLAVADQSGSKGIDLQTTGGTSLFSLNESPGGFAISNATVTSSTLTNAASTNTAFFLTLTQTAAAAGTFTLNRTGGLTQTAKGTYTGDPGQLHLYAYNTGQGTTSYLFANSLAIVPEPGTWTLLLLGGAGALGLARRRAGRVSGKSL